MAKGERADHIVNQLHFNRWYPAASLAKHEVSYAILSKIALMEDPPELRFWKEHFANVSRHNRIDVAEMRELPGGGEMEQVRSSKYE